MSRFWRERSFSSRLNPITWLQEYLNKIEILFGGNILDFLTICSERMVGNILNGSPLKYVICLIFSPILNRLSDRCFFTYSFEREMILLAPLCLQIGNTLIFFKEYFSWIFYMTISHNFCVYNHGISILCRPTD